MKIVYAKFIVSSLWQLWLFMQFCELETSTLGQFDCSFPFLQLGWLAILESNPWDQRSGRKCFHAFLREFCKSPLSLLFLSDSFIKCTLWARLRHLYQPLQSPLETFKVFLIHLVLRDSFWIREGRKLLLYTRRNGHFTYKLSL